MDGETMMANSGSSDLSPLCGRRILLTDTNRWPVTARLAVAFQQIGGTVAVLCPMPGHPVQKVSAVHARYRYSGTNPVDSLERAIRDFNPEFVIPACDRGVRHLHRLHAMAAARGKADEKLVRLIERSLGDPSSYRVTTSRFELLDIARSEGILVPETVEVGDGIEVETRTDSWPQPLVLKADGTWGGRGVRISASRESLRSEVMDLVRRPGLLKVLKLMLLNRSRDWILHDWQSGSRSVIAQSMIRGRPANCAVVCWRGEVLAGIAVEVVSARGELGPSTIVEVVEGKEMMAAAERIAARLHLSGFFGLDFMIDTSSGAHYLIEMNPRCTPICSLALGEGRDLVTALMSQMSGGVLTARKSRTQKSTIAFFPQVASGEVDATYNNLLASAYMDIPDEEPGLMEEFLHPWSERSIAGRVVDRIRARKGQKQAVAPFNFERVVRCSSSRPDGKPEAEMAERSSNPFELSITSSRMNSETSDS
jgi:hypothetical protein